MLDNPCLSHGLTADFTNLKCYKGIESTGNISFSIGFTSTAGQAGTEFKTIPYNQWINMKIVSSSGSKTGTHASNVIVPDSWTYLYYNSCDNGNWLRVHKDSSKLYYSGRSDYDCGYGYNTFYITYQYEYCENDFTLKNNRCEQSF